jgi:hypothetical protein
MSAHPGASGLTRPQMAIRADARAIRRRAMAVAAATLCAPALAVTALAAIAAAGGGSDGPGMSTLPGAQGLRGTTEPATVAAAPSASFAEPKERRVSDRAGKRAGSAGAHRPARAPEPEDPVRTPERPARPAPERNGGTPQTRAPSYPMPTTGPGAPLPSDTSPTSSGTGTTDSSQSGLDYGGGSGSGGNTDGRPYYGGG